MQQWSLSQASFDEFLATLDSDRDRAGDKYEALRIRIVRFFEWRACRDAENLADRTLDRVMQKVALGEQINDPNSYAYGVARFLYLESVKQQAREQAVIIKMPPVEVSGADDEELRLACLEHCLKQLSERDRLMILQYYRNERQAKIDHRKLLAKSLQISVNALRSKTLRIRMKLEECVLNCVDKGLA